MDLKAELRTLRHQLYDAVQLAESVTDYLDTPEGEKKSELEAELEEITRERDAAFMALESIHRWYNKAVPEIVPGDEKAAQWVRSCLDSPQFDQFRYRANGIAEMARMLSPDWGKK
jgi:hypothetical protein